MSLNAEEMRIFGEEVVMDVTYADLLIGRRIGQGACSAVHVAEHERSGQRFAVKMFNAFDKGAEITNDQRNKDFDGSRL